MGELSRLHLSSATARGGFHRLPELAPEAFQWPEGATPEAADWQGVDSLLDANGALRLALAGERTGQAWYSAVAKATNDPEVLSMAREFAEEEAQHVSELERWIARRPAQK